MMRWLLKEPTMLVDYEALARLGPGEGQSSIWRRQLLALIAGERALLLAGILGLAPSILAEAEIFAGHTVRDLLAHIAAWDDFHRERMALALAGRADEIAPIDLHGHNASLHQAHRAWSLAQSVAALQAARARFLETLAEAPNTDLHRAVSIPWADTLPLRTWAVWRARHDAVHGADIAAWRREATPIYESGPLEILLAALRASRDELLALATLVPPEARAHRSLYGEWTLRDIVGHIADWEKFTLESLEAGQQLDMGYGGDVQQWNEAHAHARRSQPWPEVKADYLRVRRALLHWLTAGGQKAVAATLANPWGKNTSAYRFIHFALEHERDHAAGLREALLPGQAAE